MTIKSYREKLNDKRAEIAQLQVEIDRCEATARTGDEHESAVSGLAKKRDEIVAQAFLDGTRPVTKAIDAEIAAAEQAHRAAIELGRAARNAKVILEPRAQKLEQDLQAIESENGEAASLLLNDLFEKALVDYQRGFDTVNAALTAMEHAAAAQGGYSSARANSLAARLSALTREIRTLGLVSAPPNTRQLNSLSGFTPPDISLKQRKAIAKTLEQAGFELPEYLAQLLVAAKTTRETEHVE